MKITRQSADMSASQWDGWHVLLIAEAGFSMLDIYGHGHYKLHRESLQQFAYQINKADSVATLFPVAPISAMPRRFIRDDDVICSLSGQEDFKKCVLQFLVSNEVESRAEYVVLDLRASSAPVPRPYIEIMVEALEQHCMDGTCIQDAAILTGSSN